MNLRSIAMTVSLTVLLSAAGVALGFACGSSGRSTKPGSSLPPAGSPQDDGHGVLARWSVATPRTIGQLAITPTGRSRGGGANSRRRDRDRSSATHRGNRYGGSIYANYRFDPSTLGAIKYGVPPGPFDGYRTDTTIVATGAIEGSVSWPHPPRTARTLATDAAPATQSDGHTACGATVRNDTLQMDASNRVANTVVYIDHMKRGNSGAQQAFGGVVELLRCRFRPHVQIAGPIGVALHITDSDGVVDEVRATSWSTTPRTTTRMQWSLGQRGHTLIHGLDRAGFYRIDIKPGGHASAWVVVPRHPYYALTDDDGRFRIDDVPPGVHTLVVWHEPVITPASNGMRQQTKPTSIRLRVKVSAHKTTTVVATLPAGR